MPGTRTTPPVNPNWSGLSPRGREILGHVAMRLSAGYSTAEVAAIVEAERDEIRHLPLPKRGCPVTRNWVAAQLRDLRAEPCEVSQPAPIGMARRTGKWCAARAGDSRPR